MKGLGRMISGESLFMAHIPLMHLIRRSSLQVHSQAILLLWILVNVRL